MRVDPVDPAQPSARPERRDPATHESTPLAQQEQLAKAQDQSQRFTTTVQDSQYTNKGSLIDQLA